MQRSGLISRANQAAGAILGLLLLTGGLAAQESGPAPAAARLSHVDGQVRTAQGGQTLADPALANAPLFEGTDIATANEGRAEIQFDDGSVARLSPASDLLLNVLRQGNGGTEAELVLEQGLGYFELQGGGQSGSIKVRFGDTVVTANGFTVLRINLDNSSDELAVFSGNAHLERGGAVLLDLHGGESVALSQSDPTRYTLADSIEPDSWDSWNADRDQALNTMAASRTQVASELGQSANPAWGDLDTSGLWYNVQGAGYVWSPYEASSAGWEPYASGYWMWTPGYGYIWVSGFSWGYLPFQCGMWNFYDGFGWGWAPGMGGCPMWWGEPGGYRGPNIGNAPGGFRPIRRPGPLPPRHRVGPLPVPHPLLAVHRPLQTGIGALPPRERATPVTIAGENVRAVHPTSPRAPYERAAGDSNHSRSEVAPVQGRPAYTGSPRPGYIRQEGNGGSTEPRTSGGGASTAPSNAHPSSGSSSHPTASGGSMAGHSGGSPSGGGASSHVSAGGSSGGGSTSAGASSSSTHK